MDPKTSLNNRNALSKRRDAIKRYLRSVMVLNNIQYRDLCTELRNKGIDIKEDNLRSKVVKGQLPSDLLTLLLSILGVSDKALAEIEELVTHD